VKELAIGEGTDEPTLKLKSKRYSLKSLPNELETFCCSCCSGRKFAFPKKLSTRIFQTIDRMDGKPLFIHTFKLSANYR